MKSVLLFAVAAVGVWIIIRPETSPYPVGGFILFAVATVAVWLMIDKKRKPSQSGIAFVVTAKPPASHTLQNLFILAGLAGLAWFFWWVTHTNIMDMKLPG
jgi:hypothetical protein